MSLDSLTSIVIAHRYWILVPLSLLEGPIVAFAAAALASRGYFDPYAAFGLFVVKDLLVDGGYYYAGRLAAGRRETSRLMARVSSNLDQFRVQWTRHAWRTTLAGKLCWGIGPIVLATGGVIGVPAKAFFTYVLIVALLQYGVLFALGYSVGRAFQAVSVAMRAVQFVVAASVVAAILYGRWRLRALEETQLG